MIQATRRSSWAVGFLALALLIASPAISNLGAQDFGFGDVPAEGTEDPGSSQGGGQALSLAGQISFALRAYPRADLAASSSFEARPAARLDLSWRSQSAEAGLSFRLDPRALRLDPVSLLDEAWISLWSGAAELKAGLFRVTWGKADSLHVLDVLDPADSSDPASSDLRYAKLAQPTVKLDFRFSDTGKLELAWLPLFQPGKLPLSGRWLPYSLAKLAGKLAASPYSLPQPVDLPAILQFPATDSLAWSQAGARLTGSLGSLDYGLQYYYGFLRDPAFDIEPAGFADRGGTVPVGYDRLHQIGADAAFVLGGFNLRTEVALNLTSDAAGDDPLVHNRSVGWALGLDRDILGFSVNLQSLATFTLGTSGISLPYDIESGSVPFYDILVLRLARSLFNERLGLEATAVWILGSGELLLKPKAAWIFPGEVQLSAEVAWYFGQSDRPFGYFRDSSFVEVALSLPF